MSSFRPDPPYVDRSFRPAPGTAARATGFAAAGDATRAEPRRPRAPVPACTPDQHAALERAAFEKGAASAAADVARCEAACAAFEAAASAMERASVRLLHESREAMLALAAEIARRWIGEELRLDPARLAGPLDRALAHCEGASAARILLHPESLAALEETLPERVAAWSGRLAVELAGDASLEPHGFRIETAAQSVDAGLDTLAPRLREALAAAFEAGPAAGTGEGAPC